MIYDVRHKTTYTYASPVAFMRCVLRLTPQSSATQTLESFSVAVTPAPAQSHERAGPFGENTLTLVVEDPHSELVIDARSRVDVHAPTIERPADSPAWESVAAASLEVSELGPLSPADFLFPTPRTPLVPAITAYARTSFAAGRPIVDAAADLMRRIHADFVYDSEATNAATAPAEAFAARHGVCQDFASIMICGLRGLGLPAAYVAGYLRTIPPPGRPRLEGADATHAWPRLWCGAARGWIGFDPTNAIFAENDHITLTVGRDAADAAPIEGVLLTSGEQTLKVEVDVAPHEAASAPRPLPADGGRG